MRISVSHVILSVLVAVIYFFLAPKIADWVLQEKKKRRKKPLEIKELNPYCWYAVGLVSLVATYFALEKFDVVHLSFFLVFELFSAVISMIDFRARIIPNELVMILSAIGFIYSLVTKGLQGLGVALIAPIVLFILFMIIMVGFQKLTGKQFVMGAGDLKLMMAASLVVGNLAGFQIFLLGMAGFMMAYILIGLGLKKITLYSLYPMAAFIMLGMLLGLFERILI